MKLQVLHRTHFKYASPVVDSFNEARLLPINDNRQKRHSHILRVTPATRLSHYRDLYNNYVQLFDILTPHRELIVTATSTVTTSNEKQLAPDARPATLQSFGSTPEFNHCYDFMQGTSYVDLSPEIWRLALDITDAETDAWQTARKIMHYIFKEFRYESGSTHVHTHTNEVLESRQGVCQDFAHVMIGLCRSLKIPTRYVSGYLYNGPADDLLGSQASHAWVEVLLPKHGWIGLDPTNNQQVDGRYVKIGVGRDFSDVTPISGSYRGTGKQKMAVEVLVTLLDADASR